MSDTHGHDHGHGHAAAVTFDIIPESSGVDTFLTYYLCTFALVILCIFGVSMVKGHPLEESASPGNHAESPAH